MDASVTRRSGVFVFVILVGAAILVGGGFDSKPQPVTNPEFATDRLIDVPLSTGGEVVPAVLPDHQLGTIVIDTGHRNRFDRDAISPLVIGITTSNNQVRYHRDDEDLAKQLHGAKAYVVISPGMNYSEDQLDMVS